MALLRDRDGKVRRVRLLLPVDSYDESDEETGITGGGPTGSDNMEERLARIERALRVPLDTGRIEREVAQAATNTGPEDELSQDEWREIKNRIKRAAQRKRPRIWSTLPLDNQAFLDRLCGAKANELHGNDDNFAQLVDKVVDEIDRIASHTASSSRAAVAESSAGTEDRQRLIEQEALENERRQLIQQVASRAAQKLGCAETDLLEEAKTALENTGGYADRAVEFLLDQRQAIPDTQPLANDQVAIAEMIAQALGYKSYKSARRQHGAIDQLAGSFAARAEKARTEEALETAIKDALEAGTLRECSR